ncbi:hypothetical protein ACJMK2_024557 [Sinanodonta woodiana]|uniref:CARD domain-containing protein n=1 Tax=Sinanodonta woodiana TaxID=1069815 RepID=A0ABD3XG53_SINWO
MAAEANVNYIGFHTVKGDNVQMKEDIATWTPVANGAAAFSEQPLSAGVPVEVEITGSGHAELGIIAIDPEKLKCKPLYRLEDIPQYFQINKVQVHKRKCRITASLLTDENIVIITYDVNKYTQTIKSGMKVWLAIYVNFGDLSLKLYSCGASNSYNPIFSAIKGPNLQFGDGMNEVRTISSKPGAICFIKNPLKVSQRMNFTCERLPGGRTQSGTSKRSHLTIYITEADPVELYRQHKDIFTVSAAQTSEPSWVCSFIIRKDNCSGQINIEMEPGTIILTDALNNEVRKRIHIDQRTKLWVALELFRVSVRQVEVSTLTSTDDSGAAQGYISAVNEPQRQLNIERHNSIPYIDVEGNAPDIERINDQPQQETFTRRDEIIQFKPSYNGYFSKLVNDLTPISLCDELLSLEIITGQQYEEIRLTKPLVEQNRKLLPLLWRRPVSKLQFISCLQNSGNEHLVQYFFPN